MSAFLLRRFGQAVLLLLIVSMIGFAILPGASMTLAVTSFNFADGLRDTLDPEMDLS